MAASLASAAPEKFYRIVEGPNPGPQGVVNDRFAYGADVLYTGDVKGNGPIRVEGTVWHSNPAEAKFYVGTRNPVIQEPELMALISDDKWEEAKVLQKYVPDAFPKTENIGDVLKQAGVDVKSGGRAATMARIGDVLRARYPNGFFMKQLSGFDSNGTLPTEKTDFVGSYEGYARELKPRAEQILRDTGKKDEIHFELKEERFYEGRVLDAIFDDPRGVIVQEKIRARVGGVERLPNGKVKTLVEEYRVHVIEGKVLEGATLNRWEDARNVSPEVLREAEVFAQATVNRLPEKMRRLSYGMDVIRTENGGFQIIELNVGGESGYFYPDTDAWVTQLLAERYLGRETPILKAIRGIERAKTTAEVEQRLEKFLKRKEIVEPLVDPDLGMPDLMRHVKNRLLNEVRRAPTDAAAMDAVYMIRKYKLGWLLNAADVETLGTVLRGAGKSVTEARLVLGMTPGELLFFGPAEGVRFLHGVRYEDSEVVTRVEKLARERARRLRIDRGDFAEVERMVKDVVSESVVTRGQLRARPELADLVTKDLSSSLSETVKLLYRRGEASLVAEVLRIVIKR